MKFPKNAFVFEINTLNPKLHAKQKLQLRNQNGLILVFLDRNLELLLYFKSAFLNSLKCNGSQSALFGYFWAVMLKKFIFIFEIITLKFAKMHIVLCKNRNF